MQECNSTIAMPNDPCRASSSPTTFHSFFPPDLFYRPRQRRLDLAFRKRGKVVICRRDVL